MSQTKILIIEDELIIAQDLQNQLVSLGYEPIGIAKSYNKALDILSLNTPDLALVDIKLKGVKDGIDLARIIKENYNIPVVFLTSHADKATVQRAKKVSPEGYLVKPFERDDLFTTIEIALSNFSKRKATSSAPSPNTAPENYVANDAIFVRHDNALLKIPYADLKWIKADGNYLTLYFADEHVLIRATLKEIMEKLPREIFIQTHRSHAVNKQFIQSVERHSITLRGYSVPVGRSYYNKLKNTLLE